MQSINNLSHNNHTGFHLNVYKYICQRFIPWRTQYYYVSHAKSITEVNQIHTSNHAEVNYPHGVAVTLIYLSLRCHIVRLHVRHPCQYKVTCDCFINELLTFIICLFQRLNLEDSTSSVFIWQ